MRWPFIFTFLTRDIAWLAAAASGAASAGEPAGSLDYDRQAPLAVEERSHEMRGAVVVRDVTFAATPGEADGGRTAAWIVAPATNGDGPGAGILWVHWLGDPATTNRSQFLDDAIALAELGVVSVLPDTMWAEPHWYQNRKLDEDHLQSRRQVVALQRALDLLLVQPGVERSRIGFVGHDYGAMYGLIAFAVHGGVRTAVLIAPTASLEDWAFFVRQPASLEDYREQNRPFDLTRHLQRARGLSTFFQFAEHDRYVPLERAEEIVAVANQPRVMRVYAGAGHDMAAPADIRWDRTAWLRRELGLRGPDGGAAPEAVVRGPYLGQPEPGTRPELFAPGVISRPGRRETNAAFSPDGRTMFFTLVAPDGSFSIQELRRDADDTWSAPVRASFANEGNNGDAFFHPAGKRVYFGSTRPPGTPPWNGRIWFADRQGGDWAAPQYLPLAIETEKGLGFPTISRRDRLFFGSYAEKSELPNLGRSDIYVVDVATSLRPRNPGAPLNSPHEEWDPCIAPDESYLLFQSDRPGGVGSIDLWVSFRQPDGAWGEPINLGPEVNTPGVDVAAKITPDGRFIFFDRPTRTEQDLLWVSTDVITRLKPALRP